MIDKFEGEHRFLSNFWPSDVELDGDVYPTVEHAYQAAKSLDKTYRKRVRLANSPTAAKRMGQKVKLRSDWEQIKIEIMTDLVRQKFEHDELSEELFDTKPHELVEGNWWGDTFWGVCKGVGENHLGKILMEIRDESK